MPNMPQEWEYQLLSKDCLSDPLPEIRALAEEGWELFQVVVVPIPSGKETWVNHYFRRRPIEARPDPTLGEAIQVRTEEDARRRSFSGEPGR